MTSQQQSAESSPMQMILQMHTRQKTFLELEQTLNNDVAVITNYCSIWRLKPNTLITVSSAFYLNNQSAKQELNIHMNGQRLKHDANPVYLGITLDRTLTYKEHLKCIASKLKSRNNLLAKLTGTSWGLDANTLKTAALALCYSVAEYCAPAWSRSAHTSLVDVQLNNTI